MNKETHQRILKNVRYALFINYIKKAMDLCPIESINSNLADELAYADDYQEDFRLTDQEWADRDRTRLIESLKKPNRET